MGLVSRIALRACLRAHIGNELRNRTDLTPEQRSSMEIIKADRKLMTVLMNKVQENLITDSTPATPGPADPTPAPNDVKHPFLKFLFDHREEILAFIVEIIKVMKPLFGG